MIVVGIDPGYKGAIATISTNNSRPRKTIPMPIIKVGNKNQIDENAVRDFLERRHESIQHVFIEKVHSMPKQGVASTFAFGAGWGLLRGICVGLRLPYTLVHSTTWKKVICKDVPKGKDAGILVAKRLWPGICLLPTTRSKKDSDGIADALCIAEYGRRTLIGALI